MRGKTAGGGGGDGRGGGSTNPVPPKSLVFLHEWWLVKQRKGLAVGGVASLEKNRESLFLSTVVTKREEANVLHTQDGITIVFRGFMNTSRSSQNGVPLEVCQHFLVGFPHDWNKYAPHSYGDSSASSVDNMECENSNTAGLNMCNSEKGISVQREGNGGYLIGTDPSEKDTVKPPSSTKKVKPIRQKIVLDASNSFSRMVTRSISKKMLHNAKKT